MLSQEIACQDQCCKFVSKPYLNRLCKRRQPMRKAGILFFDPQTHKILLVQSKGNFWGIPKGTSESNETVTECAIREVWEETGLQVDPKQLINRFDVYNQANRIIFMQDLLIKRLKTGEMEDVLLISTELTELTATDSFQLTIAPYFSERVISHNIDLHKKYDFIMRAHATSNLINYRRYLNFDTSITRHLEEIGEIIGNPLRLKIMNQNGTDRKIWILQIS